jgi:hypothetical protein
MDVKRWKAIALAALAALTLATTAQAVTGQSRQLRTSKISQKSAAGTLTFSNFAGTAGDVSGRVKEDSLIVIDEIDYTAIADVADEQWTIVVKDDSGNEMFRLMQQVTASTADNIAKVFPSGLPVWNGTVATSVFTPGTTPSSSGYAIVVTNAVGTGYLTVFWHFELPGDRAR